MSTTSGGLSAFLFTDIEGSSLRWLNHRAEMEKAVARHDEILRGVVDDHGGEVFKASGDAFYAAFARPADAVNAAVAAQRALMKEDFSAVEGLRVRMAIHVGSAERRGSDFFGPALNRTARLIDLAHGGQILVTASLPELLAAERDVHATFDRIGTQPLDDPAQPVGVYQVVAPGLPEAFPPLRTAKTRLPDAPARDTPSVLRTRPRSLALFAGLAALGVAIVAVGLISYWRKPVPANASAGPAIPEKSIAVLPFENLSEEKQNEFFANGIQDEILTDLARIADLKVISRSSVMQYKSGAPRNLREIAPALGVVYILEGSVQRAGGKVRVTAQLIDSRSDAHVWADRYDRDLADVFAIQSEIAEKIAGQLKVRLSDSEKAAFAAAPTADVVAYELYLRAKEVANSAYSMGSWAQINQSVSWLNEAVARDPSFHLAWCLLAAQHDMYYFSGSDATPGRLALAQAAVDAAARLKPDTGETYAAQALHYYQGYRDYERAFERLALAKAKLPNDAKIFYYTGLIQRRQGKWEESNRNIERGLELDPRNENMLGELGDVSYRRQRRYDDARRILRRLEALQATAAGPKLMLCKLDSARDANLGPRKELLESLLPRSAAPTAEVAQMALDLAFVERDAAAAERALDWLAPKSSAIVVTDGFPLPRSFLVGEIAMLRGDYAAAKSAYAEARPAVVAMLAGQANNPDILSLLSVIDAGLGNKEEALRNARLACEIRPIAKDAIFGADIALTFAMVATRVGEKDLALSLLTELVNIPSGINYGNLSLDFEWDSLRGDARFEALVAKLAPKASLK